MVSPRELQSWLSNATRWGLYLLLPLPLYISSSMLFPYITGRNFAFRIIIELLAAAWLGLLLVSREHRPRLTALTKSVIIFLFIVTLADILGANPYRSFWSNYERMEGLLALLHMGAFFLLASSVFRTFNQWRAFFYASTAVSLVVAYTGLAQRLGFTQSLQGGFRVDGTIGNPAYLASYLMFHVFFLLFFLWREQRTWVRWVAGIAIIFELSIIYMTATRGVIIGMVPALGLVGLGLSFMRPKSTSEARLKKAAIGFLAAGAVLIGLFFVLKDSEIVRGSPVLRRLANISLQERTTESRLLIWKMALEGVKERPILGWGQENFYVIFNKYFEPKLYASEPWFDRSHNVMLDWAVHAGILGLLAYLGVLFFGVKNIWRAYKKTILAPYEAIILAGLFVAYFLQNLFVFDNYQSYFLLFLTLAFTDYLANAGNGKPAEETRASASVPVATGALAAFGILAIISVYFLNIRPIRASQDTITVLNSWRQGAPVAKIQEGFQKVFDRTTFGSGEAREQMASLTREAIGSTGRGSGEQIKGFVDFSLAELKELTEGESTDAKHLLFVGSVANVGVGIDPSYAQTAIEALVRALEIAPKKQIIYFELGHTYLLVGDVARSLETMQKAVALEPSSDQAQLNLALVALAAGDRAMAGEAITRYRELVPNPAPLNLRRIAQGYLQMGDLASVRMIFQEIIDINPGDAQAWAQFAAILAMSGDREGAISAAGKAAELDPQFKAQSEEFIRNLRAGKPIE